MLASAALRGDVGLLVAPLVHWGIITQEGKTSARFALGWSDGEELLHALIAQRGNIRLAKWTNAQYVLVLRDGEGPRNAPNVQVENSSTAARIIASKRVDAP